MYVNKWKYEVHDDFGKMCRTERTISNVSMESVEDEISPYWIKYEVGDSWQRGREIELKWKVMDPSVKTISIEILNRNFPGNPTIIGCNLPNTGSFMYRKVPWGMPICDQYYLRFTADSVVYHHVHSLSFSII